MGHTPDKSTAANRRPAGQSDGSGNLSAIIAADGAFPATVAELGRWAYARMKTRFILCLFLAVVLLSSSGCMTTHAVLDQANVQDHVDKDGKFTEETVEKPGWLVLVPFAALFDLATGPIQFVYLLITFRDGH